MESERLKCEVEVLDTEVTRVTVRVTASGLVRVRVKNGIRVKRQSQC